MAEGLAPDFAEEKLQKKLERAIAKAASKEDAERGDAGEPP
jgi:hypothetical protein